MSKTIEPPPCVDKNGVYVTKGMTVRYPSGARTPPFNPVTREGVVTADPILVRNVGGKPYWTVCIEGNGRSIQCACVYTLEAVVAERLQRGPSDAEVERAAIAAWLRSEPETVKECNGHRHKDGKKCLVIVPMTREEMAVAIERGEHRRKEEE